MEERQEVTQHSNSAIEQLNFLLVDDHPLFRNALKYSLSDLTKQPILESENFASTMNLLRETPFIDVIFLDLAMPDVNGLEGLVTILNEFPEKQVIMISAHEDPNTIAKAKMLGANGFIPKSTELDALKNAVIQTLSGENWYPVDNLQDDVDQEFLQKLHSLTPHQLKVLQYMADGLLNKQIAFTMEISESTVKQHASAVLKKLGLINRTQAGVIYRQYLDISDTTLIID